MPNTTNQDENQYGDWNALNDFRHFYPKIVQAKSRPFHMNNAPLAVYFLSKLHEIHPEAQCIDFQGQWLCLTSKHINYGRSWMRMRTLRMR